MQRSDSAASRLTRMAWVAPLVGQWSRFCYLAPHTAGSSAPRLIDAHVVPPTGSSPWSGPKPVPPAPDISDGTELLAEVPAIIACRGSSHRRRERERSRRPGGGRGDGRGFQDLSSRGEGKGLEGTGPKRKGPEGLGKGRMAHQTHRALPSRAGRRGVSS